MSHRRENIQNHHAGNDRLIELEVREKSDDPTKEYGDPKSLIDSEVRYFFSEKRSGTDCIFTKSTKNGGATIVDADNGKVEIKWDSPDTKGLDGIYYHECEVENSNGEVATVFRGEVEVVSGLNC